MSSTSTAISGSQPNVRDSGSFGARRNQRVSQNNLRGRHGAVFSHSACKSTATANPRSEKRARCHAPSLVLP